MVDYTNNFNGYVNNNINGSIGLPYAPENNNIQMNNGKINFIEPEFIF